MIELRNYALSEKSRAIFELCKSALTDSVGNYPSAAAVVKLYTSVPGPHNIPPELCKTQYTDQYVSDVNDIITEIMLKEDPEELGNSFALLTNLIE